MAALHQNVEYLDVLTKTGEKTGISKPRGDVHRDGDYHRAVYVWIYAESTQELLLQCRADCKDSWPGRWDASSAGHISAGDSSLVSAMRELQEELGITLPKDAFELIFSFLQECVINDGTFINNEYDDVYLVTTIDPIPLDAFTFQESEVSAVKYIPYHEYRSLLAKEDPNYVPYDVNSLYGQIFEIIEKRYKESVESRSLALQKQLNRYAHVSLSAEVLTLSLVLHSS
nr:nudix hydrolase 3 [Ipomoea batatas]